MAAYFTHVGAFNPKAEPKDINRWLDRFDACVQLNGIASMVEGTDDVVPVQGVDVGAVEKANEQTRHAFLIAEIGPIGFGVLKNKILLPSTPYKTHSYYWRKHLRDYFSPPHTQELALWNLRGDCKGWTSVSTITSLQSRA